MIITLKKDVPKAEVEKLIHTFENKGPSITMIQGDNYSVFGLVGDTSEIDEKLAKAHPLVENVTRTAVPYKKANRLFHPADTIVNIVDVKAGGNEKIVVISGPCSVEGDTQITDIVKEVKNAGGDMLHGGVYKPRVSPYTSQDIGIEGVRCMVHARETYELPVVSELMNADKTSEFAGHVDLIQIDAGSMQNFDLLRVVGYINKLALSRRGLADTIKRQIMAAEYIMSEGNENVIFYECGTRTSETYTRDILGFGVVLIIKEETHLSIIIDPSHATGDWKLVEPASLAAIAANADGSTIEVHNDPGNARSDDAQSLRPERFGEVIYKGRKIAEVIGCSMQVLLPLYT